MCLDPESASRAERIEIVLSPHFDDAVWSLGGFMARIDGEPIIVATFFAGKPEPPQNTEWDNKISGFRDSTEAMQARMRENERALSRLGIPLQGIRNYGHLDGQYRLPHKESEIRAAIGADIESLVSAHKGCCRTVCIYGPATFGPGLTQPDHKIVHDAFFDFAKRSKDQDVQAFIYEDFPYIRRFLRAGKGNMGDCLQREYGLPFSETVITFTKEQLTRKIEAICEYDSQVKALSVSDKENIPELAESFCRHRYDGGDSTTASPCEVVYRIPTEICGKPEARTVP